MRKHFLLIGLLILTTGIFIHAQNKAEDIVGIWLTDGDDPAKIQIYRSGEKYFGKIIWMKNPMKNGKQRLDIHNPDIEKRANSVIGLLILKDFKFNNKGEWKGGDIYDPENGKMYSSYMYLKDKNTLKLRGYIGISLLGRTETWIRSK